MVAGPTVIELQRFRFIETCLLWEGRIRRRAVSEAFKLSDNHVTREITKYRKKHSKNLVYDAEKRTWRISPKFVAAYATGDVDEYLTLLHAYALSGDRLVMLRSGPPVVAETLPQSVGKIERAVLREIIVALKSGHGARVRYQSFSEADPAERTLYPHALVFANGRWHVRAYDDRKERFGDFVLTRIIKAKSFTDPAPHPPSADVGWQEKVTVHVVPTSSLSASQHDAIVREYGMRQKGGVTSWAVPLRTCLVKYFLQAHRLDLPDKHANHRRIALLDPKVASDYAFVDD
ncbi:WYL domain-containing protein [Xanthomonas translucens pv. graminis]|uniref:WYL domain-containing protein n=1 Tax=Xanthomonas graminis TaxID=3390026 RepID=UPI002541BB50|nr:WYL domain-containing protein [Xanthomonas translucens]WIH05135.1 WYL domain-containing protein [Xanthomonas translucens pv. graminis]